MASFSIKYIFSMVDQFTGPASKLGQAAAAMSKNVHSAGAAADQMASKSSRIASAMGAVVSAVNSAARAVGNYVTQMAHAAAVKPIPPPLPGQNHRGAAWSLSQQNSAAAVAAAGGKPFSGLALGAGLSYFSGGGKQIFDTNLKFQTEFNNARAVMSKSTAEDFAAMEKQVISLSKSSVFSATQIMKSVGELGSAGYEAKEAMAILPQVLQMAQAGREPLDKTAEMLIAIKNQFGIGDDKMQHVNDVLSETARQTMAKLPDLREAFKMAGPFAQIANVDLETTSALLGALAQKGIKGSLAGTGLRRMETGFLKADKKSLEFLNKYRIDPREVYTADGKMRDLVGTLAKLESRGVKAKDVMKAFGDRGGPILAALLETGSVSIRKLIADLRDSEGAAEKMAGEQMKGLPGAFNKMKAAIEAARLSIGKSGFEDDMIGMLDRVKGLANWFSELPAPMQRAAGAAAVAGAALAGLALPVALLGFAFNALKLGKLVSLVAWLGRLAMATRLAKFGLTGLGALGVLGAVKSLNDGESVHGLSFPKDLALDKAGREGTVAMLAARRLLGDREGIIDDRYFGLHALSRDAEIASLRYNANAAINRTPMDNFSRLPEAQSGWKDYLPRMFQLGPQNADPMSWNGRSFSAAAASSIPQSMSIHVDPIQVNAPPSVRVDVNVTGQVNGPVSGSGSGEIPFSTQPSRGTATPDAGPPSGRTLD